MTMKSLLNLAGGLGLSLVAACGGSVETSPTGAGGSSSATTGTATTSTSTSTMTSTSTGNGGSCPGFEDAKGPSAVTVRFHNKTPGPIYLPGRCSDVDYAIVPINGPDGVSYNFDSSCLQTCSALQTSPPFACGACAPRSYRVDSGATLEVTWDGTGLQPDVQMPLSCWDSPQGQNTTCNKIVAAPAGKYRINAVGFSSCGPDCACDAGGICTGSTEGTQAQADPVKFAFTADKVVDVVFNVCAFGCPD